MAVTRVFANGIAGGLKVDDKVVVTKQQAAIADITPTADGTTAGTAVNAILAALRAHGLIASS